MPRINEASSEQAKALAKYIDTQYGNRSGNVSKAEVARALNAVASDPVLKTKLADVFASVPSRPEELLKALFARPPGPGAVSVGARAGGKGEIFLQADGRFSIGPSPSAGTLASAPALYEAALLIADGKNPFSSLNTAEKVKALSSLEDAAKLGAERSIRERKPSERTMQLKSGSATALLALAEASSASEDASVREKAISTYLDVAEKEIHRGIKVSMAVNLQAARKKLSLTGEQAARLDGLMATALPPRPPYEEWFKNGNKLNIKHYIHEEFYESLIRPYEYRGFTRRKVSEGHEFVEGRLTDPTGHNPPVDVRVEIFKVEDYGTDRKMLRDMNDPDVQIETYTGHSNLGGNIAMALQAAPTTEVGTKLVHLGMCRGKQNVAEFTNRFPNAHLITTSNPEYASGINDMTTGMLDMISRRAGYDYLDRNVSTYGDYLIPNDPRLYDYRDLDKDGVIDGGAKTDKVFDIYPRTRQGEAISFKPGASVDPAKVDGTAVLNAINFANTLLTYHVEHGGGSSPITSAFTDRMIADGYFKSDGEEFLRITPENIDGAIHYRVAVNSRYAGQSEDVLGMRTLYELNRYITEKTKGRMDLNDKVRGLLLSAEWLSYMVGPGDLSEELTANLGKVYGWPRAVTFDAADKALERDSHGYVSRESVNAFIASLRTSLGDGGSIV